jgi:hypothetical protein
LLSPKELSAFFNQFSHHQSKPHSVPAVMPIGRTLRNLLFVIIFIAALLHEPTLKSIMSILVHLHITMYIAYDAVCPTIFKHLSSVAPWLIDLVYELRALFIALWEASLNNLTLAMQ